METTTGPSSCTSQEYKKNALEKTDRVPSNCELNKETEMHLLGYDFRKEQCIELQHRALISQTTILNPARDERPLGSGTILPNHLLLRQNTC